MGRIRLRGLRRYVSHGFTVRAVPRNGNCRYVKDASLEAPEAVTARRRRGPALSGARRPDACRQRAGEGVRPDHHEGAAAPMSWRCGRKSEVRNSASASRRPLRLIILLPSLRDIISVAEPSPRAMKANGSLEIPDEALAAFCRRWRIRELALFGSALREDFGPDSDIDVLVRFERDVGWDLWDIIDMQEELGAIFGRPVDLVDRDAVEGSGNACG